MRSSLEVDLVRKLMLSKLNTSGRSFRWNTGAASHCIRHLKMFRTQKNIGVEFPHINLQNRLDYEVFCQSEDTDVLQMRGSTAYVKLSDIRSSSGVTKAVLLEFGEETTNSCKNYAMQIKQMERKIRSVRLPFFDEKRFTVN